MSADIKILGLTGSLRKGSYNKAALRASRHLLPEGAVLEIADLSDIPFLNEDEELKGRPASVVEFRKKITEADALLIATPEYNFSIPPVLKNALDWASRGEDTPLPGKPTAIMSASPGRLGGARVQYHLRQVCTSVDLRVINRPEVFISRANDKFSEEGALVDNRTKRSITRLLAALVEAVNRSRE